MLHYQSVVARDSARLTWSEMPFYSESNSTRFVFTYSRPDSDQLLLQNEQLTIVMRRVNQPYPLFTRGFHWIQETGYIR